MGDTYEFEKKSGRIWLNAAKKQLDESTRIVPKEQLNQEKNFNGELNNLFYLISVLFHHLCSCSLRE